MINFDDLEDLRSRIPSDAELAGLLETLRSRSERLLIEPLPLPKVKALLSQDGGFCPADGSTLIFDPWSPDEHRCPRCGQSFSGDRHHRNWARGQHLWLAERAAELALIGAISGEEAPTAKANEIILRYGSLYLDLPSRDNVLGPSHLFFSTYLESVWLTSWLTAAYLLREAELLGPDSEEAVNHVADEAARVIADFNEGLSNRQTWHAAALTAVAAWFGDVELAREMVESRTGLMGHLAEGFGDDGLWYEGENYHLFAMRGLMQGMQWAQAMGFDLLDNPSVRCHFRAALLAPALSALPDFTYPARRDARYGVSLAQPSSMDLWEIGAAWLDDDAEIGSWLQALYAIPRPLPPAEHQDYWLHDAGLPDTPGGRADLSWWALLAMRPRSGSYPEWRAQSALLHSQGLAVLRQGEQYLSLECGPALGGHGHPDRLHLTIHADGTHWLPDMGTGSYVSPNLAWYRSAMAHNAPLIDGTNVGGANAWCAAFEAKENAAWCVGVAGEVKRTVIATPGVVLDIVELAAGASRTMALPLHLAGLIAPTEESEWVTAPSKNHWLGNPATRGGAIPDLLHFAAAGPEKGLCRVACLAPESTLFRADAPWLPTDPEPKTFYWLEGNGSALRWINVLSLSGAGEARIVSNISEVDNTITVVFEDDTKITYRVLPNGIEVRDTKGVTTLGGLRPEAKRVPTPIVAPQPLVGAIAEWVNSPPSLLGTFDGFALGSPMRLDRKSQYRRSETEYDPNNIAARAWLNWDGASLYLAVRVRKEHLIFRSRDAEPLRLDNEIDDIHSDGLQVFWEAARANGAVEEGFIVVPDSDGTLQVRRLAGSASGGCMVGGGWQPTDDGYLVTLRLDDPFFATLAPGDKLPFDLLINEMQPERLRRAGQLVWGGDGGWVYLIGDRHNTSRMGVVTFAEGGRGKDEG